MADVAGASNAPASIQTLVLLLLVAVAVALASRRFRVPYTLALVLVGLLAGMLHVLPGVRLDPAVVITVFLPALLFEGAWNVRVATLRAEWRPVALLALPGLGLSIAVVGAMLHWGLGIPWRLGLLLGAIVSPTDPVAVLTLMRQLGMAERLRTIVEGESLFNDGLGAAMFQILLGLLLVAPGPGGGGGSAWTTLGAALWLMLGGPIVGLLVGMAVAQILRRVDDEVIALAITVGVAYGVYLLASALQTSGLLAVVGAGLVLGSDGCRTATGAPGEQPADVVWEFIGYIANSLLFLLLGLQIGAAGITGALPGICWAVSGVLLARALAVYLLLPLHDAIGGRLGGASHSLPANWRPLIVLCGLRGAISVALVLSLPAATPQRDLLAGIVYAVVLVTLLGQGLALRLLLPRWPKTASAA